MHLLIREHRRLQRTDLTINTLLNVNMPLIETVTVTVEMQSQERLDKTKPERRNLYRNQFGTICCYGSRDEYGETPPPAVWNPAVSPLVMLLVVFTRREATSPTTMELVESPSTATSLRTRTSL